MEKNLCRVGYEKVFMQELARSLENSSLTVECKAETQEAIIRRWDE